MDAQALEQRVDKIAEDVAFIRGQLENGIVKKPDCEHRMKGVEKVENRVWGVIVALLMLAVGTLLALFKK